MRRRGLVEEAFGRLPSGRPASWSSRTRLIRRPRRAGEGFSLDFDLDACPACLERVIGTREGDHICADGTDSVFADRFDPVRRDCETVSRGPGV